jgi:hypothetical protein
MKPKTPSITIGLDLGDKKHAICVLKQDGDACQGLHHPPFNDAVPPAVEPHLEVAETWIGRRLGSFARCNGGRISLRSMGVVDSPVPHHAACGFDSVPPAVRDGGGWKPPLRFMAARRQPLHVFPPRQRRTMKRPVPIAPRTTKNKMAPAMLKHFLQMLGLASSPSTHSSQERRSVDPARW